MKHYNWLYKYTTFNLIASSLSLVLAIYIKDWSTAIWCGNAWLCTFIMRSVIRDFNNAAYLEYNKSTAKGTNE